MVDDIKALIAGIRDLDSESEAWLAKIKRVHTSKEAGTKMEEMKNKKAEAA